MENNVEIDLKGTGWDGVNWIHVAQDRHRFCTWQVFGFYKTRGVFFTA